MAKYPDYRSLIEAEQQRLINLLEVKGDFIPMFNDSDYLIQFTDNSYIAMKKHRRFTVINHKNNRVYTFGSISEAVSLVNYLKRH